MATTKEGETPVSATWSGWFSPGFYKRSQGKIARQVTFWAIVLLIGVGAYRLERTALVAGSGYRYAIALAVVAVGAWFTFRLVNMPRFADFLIAVEAEMNKVSWPSRPELLRSTIVVIVTMFVLTAALLFYDVVWRTLLAAIGVA